MTYHERDIADFDIVKRPLVEKLDLRCLNSRLLFDRFWLSPVVRHFRGNLQNYLYLLHAAVIVKTYKMVLIVK